MIIKTTIGEFCPFEYGKGLSAGKRLLGNIPVYGSNGIVGVHNEPYVTTHGIIIGRKGSVGALQISDRPFWPIDTSFYVVKDDYFETVYTFYLLKSLGLDGMNSDSAVPGLNRDNAHALQINILGTSEERKAIGRLIARFDDKIGNNRRMNETLEEMARVIFKSWFVDFDPVHAKVAGNEPSHMDAETAQMFPSAFGNDGLPLGWTKKCISDFAFRVTDKFNKGQSWDNEKLIDLGRMPSNSIALNDYGEGKELSTSINIFQKDDFLFGSIRPYFCKAGIAPFNGVTNSSVFILRCYEKKDSAFLYALCSSQDIFKKSVQFSKGTKMPAISWGDFSKFEFVNPTENIKDKFSYVTLPMFKKIQNNVAESNTLAELRNALLPKLMSGEIRVNDAEREVEAAV